MGRKSAVANFVTLPLIAAIVVAGCSKPEQAKSDSLAGAGTAPAGTTRTLRQAVTLDSARIAQFASEYDFGPERDPDKATKDVRTTKNHGVKKANKPTKLTIQTATPKRPLPDTLILALITSNGSYDDLGIGNGDNFVVRDKRGSADPHDWSVYLISTKPFSITPLKPGTEALSMTSVEEPRIAEYEFDSSGGTGTSNLDSVAYAVCLEDRLCQPSGHCGYNVF
jgi:hypothetical protein